MLATSATFTDADYVIVGEFGQPRLFHVNTVDKFGNSMNYLSVYQHQQVSDEKHNDEVATFCFESGKNTKQISK